MFFSKDDIAFRILDIVELDQGSICCSMSGRNFDSISFRFSANTELSAECGTYKVGDNSVCFMPARINYTRKAQYDKLIAIHMDIQNYFSNQIQVFTPKNSEKLAKLFCEAYELWVAKDIGYKYKCSAIVNKILAICYAENCLPEELPEAIAESVKYMREKFADPELSITDIAKKSFISDVYFRKLFKSHFGISPSKYLINLRIQNAVGLMSTGYYSLKEIAFLSGYCDYSYFSSEFKRIKGVTPMEYLYNYESTDA